VDNSRSLHNCSLLLSPHPPLYTNVTESQRIPILVNHPIVLISLILTKNKNKRGDEDRREWEKSIEIKFIETNRTKKPLVTECTL